MSDLWDELWQPFYNGILGDLGWVGKLLGGGFSDNLGDQLGQSQGDPFTGSIGSDPFSGGWTADPFTTVADAGTNASNGEVVNPLAAPGPIDTSQWLADNPQWVRNSAGFLVPSSISDSQPQVQPSNDSQWVRNSDGLLVPSSLSDSQPQVSGEDTGPKLGQPSPWTPVYVVPPSPSAPAPPTPSTVSTVTLPVASDYDSAVDRGDLPAIFVPPSYPPIDTWPTAPQPQATTPDVLQVPEITIYGQPDIPPSDDRNSGSWDLIAGFIFGGATTALDYMHAVANTRPDAGVGPTELPPGGTDFSAGAEGGLLSDPITRQLTGATADVFAGALGEKALGLAARTFPGLGQKFGLGASTLPSLPAEGTQSGLLFPPDVPPTPPSGAPSENESLFGPFSHQINRGGLSDIIANDRLISTAARGIAGGQEAVRAGVGEAQFLERTPNIEFFTAAQPTLQFGSNWTTGEWAPYQANWPLPEGEYLDIRLQRIFNPDGTIDIFNFDTP